MKIHFILPIVALLAGCSSTKVTLLPDAAGHVGNVIVKNDENVPVTLEKSGQTLENTLLGEHESELTEETARRKRPELFNAEPAPLVSETVWFSNDSIKPLTPAKRIVNSVKKACVQHDPCQLTVIGHTDGMGDEQYNMTLSLRRAKVIQRLLLSAGFATSSIDVRYHGPFDPLIKTPAGKSQPKNRRVEIMVH